MNAPLQITPDWQPELLLSANQQLESLYLKSHVACLALQICRNYRLLVTQSENYLQKERWQRLSLLWWQRYCLDRGMRLSRLSHWELFT